MKQHKAIFAGEHSGHFYFKDNFYAESSLLAGLLMIDILSKTRKTMSAIKKQFDIYPQSGEINFIIQNRNVMLEMIKNKFGKKAYSVDELEGLSFYYESFWFNVRLSKTEPLLRLNIEADTIKILEKETDNIISFIIKNGGKRK